MHLPSRKVLLFFLFFLCCNSLADFAILVPEKTGAYERIAKKLQRESLPIQSRIVTFSEFKQADAQFDLVATIGTLSYDFVQTHQHGLPIVSGFSSGIDRSTIKKNTTVIFNDINLNLQIKLIQSMYAGKTPKIGIFLSESTKYLQKDIDVLKANGVNIYPAFVQTGDDTVKRLQFFLRRHRIDSFIFTPSPEIYTSQNMSVMLYTLFSNKVSAITYTEKLVNGGVGGMASVSFDSSIITKEMSKVIKSFYHQGTLTKRWLVPKEGLVNINKKIATRFHLNSKDYENKDSEIR